MNNEKKSTNEIHKEFGMSSFAIKNSTSVLLLTLLVIVIGFSAYNSMPREYFPEIKMPKVIVAMIYPGNSPSDMEKLITRHVEKQLKGLKGVKKITTACTQDVSTTMVEFNYDIDIKRAVTDCKDAVDKAKQDLPTDMTIAPRIFEVDISNMPIVNVNISGANFTVDQLKDYAEYLKDQIEVLPEISKVEIKGALDKEVKVYLDRDKMDALDLSFYSIEDAIKMENMTVSAGDISSDDFKRTIRVKGEFKSVDEIGNIVIKSVFQKVVYLKDVATIKFEPKEADSYARMNGNNVVSLDIMKRNGANLVDGVDKVSEIIKKAQEKRLPKSLQISMTNDQSRQTRQQVEILQDHIILGVILVVLVLLFFLGLRNALFSGVAIPISMLMGFMILNFMGVTLNMMVLFSLILALGRLVDDGIVVVENIYRLHHEEGEDIISASKHGAGEVAAPVIASTLTTVTAFLPLLFWKDLMGEFMKYLPITVIITIFSSLFVAMVVNPVLTSLYMKVEDAYVKPEIKNMLKPLAFMSIAMVLFYLVGFAVEDFIKLGNFALWCILIYLFYQFVLYPAAHKFQLNFLPRLENKYDKLIRFALKPGNPKRFFYGMIGLLILSFVLMGVFSPNVVFFPDAEPKYINVFIEYPTGTDIEKTNKLTREIEQKILKATKKYGEVVEAVLTNVGRGTVDPNSGELAAAAQGTTPHKAKITISFLEFQYRHGVSTQAVLDEIRGLVKGYVGATITVDKNKDGPPAGPPISITLSGEDYPKLIEIQNKLRAKIKEAGIEGIEELKTDLDASKPEIIINVDKEMARKYGVSTGQIAGTLRTALFGKEVSKFKFEDDDYPIMLRLDEAGRKNVDDLMNQKMVFRDMVDGRLKTVPIGTVASVKYGTSYGAINRKNEKKVISLYSNVLSGYNANEIMGQLKEVAADFDLPEGYEVSFTGEQEEQAKSLSFLMGAFVVAIFLIFIIIVAQFNSISAPLIIMSSVLFSTIGVFLGLILFRMDFVVIMTMIGLIALAGVVVTNAIVMIDFAILCSQRAKAKLGLAAHEFLPPDVLRETIVEAGKIRLRPVLLTAITAVLGLLPLALGINMNFITLLTEFKAHFYIGGESVSFWGPLAWTIIFGLTFSTFLTLVIVPVMIWLQDRFGVKYQAWKQK